MLIVLRGNIRRDISVTVTINLSNFFYFYFLIFLPDDDLLGLKYADSIMTCIVL